MIRPRRRPDVRQCKKRWMGHCFFCGLADYDLLEAHRILPGAEGGRYHWANILPMCEHCHTKLHLGRIKVHGRHPSTSAAWYIHWTDEQGKERWDREDRWRGC